MMVGLFGSVIVGALIGFGSARIEELLGLPWWLSAFVGIVGAAMMIY